MTDEEKQIEDSIGVISAVIQSGQIAVCLTIIERYTAVRIANHFRNKGHKCEISPIDSAIITLYELKVNPL